MPAMPPSFWAASGMALATWYLVKPAILSALMPPFMPAEMRSSSAACSSSGRLTEATLNSSRPMP